MQQSMEILEDERNQHKHLSSKRLKIQELTLEDEDKDEDRISALPDCLILQILSFLPFTKDVIRTGTLSKRWKSLWTSIPTLVFKFTCYDLHTPYFVPFINETLTQCRHSKLHKFQLHIVYNSRLNSEIGSWIRYAISREVKVLDLRLYGRPASRFVLADQFFMNSCFTDLTLGACIFNPKEGINWRSLRSLCISYSWLPEKMIDMMLSGSPVLETLELRDCVGYSRLRITSNSVKNLVFCGYPAHPRGGLASDVIEINAPNLLSLKIGSNLVLRNILLVDVSSLVEAELNYWRYGYLEATSEEDEEEMLKGLLQSLQRVNKLNIGTLCFKVLSRLKAKGFPSPPNIQRSLIWK